MSCIISTQKAFLFSIFASVYLTEIVRCGSKQVVIVLYLQESLEESDDSDEEDL